MPRMSKEKKLKKYREIMLLLEQEVSTRDIAKKVHCSLSTIQKAQDYAEEHPIEFNDLNMTLDTDTHTDTDTDNDTDTEKAIKLPKKKLGQEDKTADTDTDNDTDTEKIDVDFDFLTAKYRNLPPNVQDSLTVILNETINRYKKWGYGNYLNHAKRIQKWKEDTR